MPLAAWRQAARRQWCCGWASAGLRLRVRPAAAAGQLRVMSKRGETEEERKARKEAVKVRAAPALSAGQSTAAAYPSAHPLSLPTPSC